MEEYKKDFDAWNEKKKHIDTINPLPCAEGEIWWCSLGLNIGSEQDGKDSFYERPILVIFRVNQLIIWAIPLSSHMIEDKYRLSLNSFSSQLILSQIRAISTKRLLRKLGKVTDEELNFAIDSLVRFLLLKKRNPAVGRGISEA